MFHAFGFVNLGNNSSSLPQLAVDLLSLRDLVALSLIFYPLWILFKFTTLQPVQLQPISHP
jgi:hypothetical protein